MSDLLDLGENVEVLDKADQSDLSRESKHLKKDEDAGKEFRERFKEQRDKLRGKTKPHLPKYPIKVWKAGNHAQEYLQGLVPPGAHIWKSNSQFNWQMHYPGLPRKSRSWAVDGEPAAAEFILQCAWRAYLTLNCLPVSACPLKGFFAPTDDGQWDG